MRILKTIHGFLWMLVRNLDCKGLKRVGIESDALSVPSMTRKDVPFVVKGFGRFRVLYDMAPSFIVFCRHALGKKIKLFLSTT